jgi:hypothetical protein
MDALIAAPGGRRVVDRRAALTVLLLAAVVTAVTLGATRFLGQSHDIRPSAAARAELLRLATAQQHATWLVHYEFDRVLRSGQRLSQASTEANRPPVHVTAAGGSVTVDFGTRTATCTATGARARCSEEPSDPSLQPAEVYRVVTALGAYSVAKLPDRTIAGDLASCFRLQATGAMTVPSVGPLTDLCYSADGVPLFSARRTATATDTRVAVTVDRKVTNAALDALLHQLDQKQAVSGH